MSHSYNGPELLEAVSDQGTRAARKGVGVGARRPFDQGYLFFPRLFFPRHQACEGSSCRHWRLLVFAKVPLEQDFRLSDTDRPIPQVVLAALPCHIGVRHAAPGAAHCGHARREAPGVTVPAW